MMSAKQEERAALVEARQLRERNRADRRDWVRRLAREGCTVTEIARRTRVGYPEVLRMLADAGIKPLRRVDVEGSP